jgi:hypothetical protein
MYMVNNVFPRTSSRGHLSYLPFVEKLAQAIERISPLKAESRSDFLAAWKLWQVPKDQVLLRQHTISDYIYYIEKGVARI